MAWSLPMAKAPRSESKQESPRRGHARAAGDLIGNIAGPTFKKFGFVQSAVVSRWAEIVGERYAKVSTPESIRFPGGARSGGTLTLHVEGAHAPLIQHLAPLITERVNRFFGYEAVAKIAFRQGRAARAAPRPRRPTPAPVPAALGEGIRQIADPELRACLEALASSLAGSTGKPAIDAVPPIPTATIRSE